MLTLCLLVGMSVPQTRESRWHLRKLGGHNGGSCAVVVGRLLCVLLLLQVFSYVRLEIFLRKEGSRTG